MYCLGYLSMVMIVLFLQQEGEDSSFFTWKEDGALALQMSYR